MSCKACGLPIKKDMRFVLVGFYPRFVDKMFFGWIDGLDYYGELYHEACYLESIKNEESKQKSGIKPEEEGIKP